jgi:transcriptional regulator with XRE-family HTH domain
MKTLAERLRERRDELDLTLREVERRTGISNAHLSQIETGKIERPDVSLLFQLAQVYDLDLVDLMDLGGHLTEGTAGSERALMAAALRAVGELPAHDKVETLNFIRRLSLRKHPPEVSFEHEARSRVEAIAERALRTAGVAGTVPTPLSEISAVAGILDKQEIDRLPEEIVSKKPGRWKKIIGAVLFPEKVIYIDSSIHERRVTFTEAHEIAHMLIPWHEAAFRLDDESRLFFDTRETLETEANAAAAHLLFQGNRYHERAADSQLSINVPIELAQTHGASMHASIRYFVERHDEPVAVLLCGRYEQFDGTLPIWHSFESASFRREHGRLTDHVPPSGLPLQGEYTLGALAAASFDSTSPQSGSVTLESVDGEHRRFLAEAFFNQYSVFVMVTPKKHLRTGRRMRVERVDPASRPDPRA